MPDRSVVVCVGDLMVDVVAMLSAALAPGSDTPAAISLHDGGAAANVAAWLARDGADVIYVGRVGDDELGRRAVAALTGAGVRLAVATDSVRSTGTCLVLVDRTGERTMVPDAGANSGLSESSALTVLPAEAAVLYVSGYALLGAGSRPFALEALGIARSRGWAIVVDAASAAPLAALRDGVFSGWVGTGVTMFANEHEARVLTGESDEHTAVMRLAAMFGEAVVKCGAAGALWSDGSAVIAGAAAPTVVRDTTGAGDAFAAGYLAAELAGAAVADRLRSGAAVAAEVIGQVGARPPTTQGQR